MLINFDCKLFRKIFAVRVISFMGDVIHPDQACAVPGRRITDSRILVRDAICLARDRHLKLAIVNLDSKHMIGSRTSTCFVCCKRWVFRPGL